MFQLVTEGKAEEALTASQKVVVDFGLMRERHGADMDIIKKRQDDGKLKLHPNYCYSTLMNLTCKVALGYSATEFRRIHGSPVRDYLEGKVAEVINLCLTN